MRVSNNRSLTTNNMSLLQSFDVLTSGTDAGVVQWPERPASTLTLLSASGDDTANWIEYFDRTTDMLKALAHDHVEPMLMMNQE